MGSTLRLIAKGSLFLSALVTFAVGCGGAKMTPPPDPVEYPEVGVYHPRLQARMSRSRADLPRVATTGKRGTVGLLLMRSYLLAGNTDHYDGVITAMEARGLRVIPAFATGLDSRPAIDAFFFDSGVTTGLTSTVSGTPCRPPRPSRAGTARTATRRLT